MVNRDEFLALANATGLSAPVIEKDYVLGWILRGIYQSDELREKWIFKGGTCLKKCYFETYRFSEDLDFTLQDDSQLDDAFLQRTFRDITQVIYEESGLELQADRTRFELYSNPRGRTSCQGRLYYRSQFQTGNNFPAVKLDLTADELLVDEAVWRPVHHRYSDEPDGGIEALCYSYDEVFAEKLRALGERTRARDLYDVVHLHRNREYEPVAARIRDILQRKCTFKEIALITIDVVHAGRELVIGTWQGMLAHQLPHLPPFDSFWSELPNIFSWLDTGAPKPALTQAPTQSSEEILRPHVGGYADLVGNAGLMERIRFAAQSGLLVALDYIRLDGQVRRPTIEPYSLRRSQSGEISLAGFDVDAGHIKMYRVDRIQSARVLDRTFSPRYAIELGPLARVLPIATRPATTMTSRVATGSSRRSSFARPSRTRAAGVPTYVVECMYCRKKFRRRSYDTALNAHKMPSGWDCPGRAGAVVDTKW
jgi:predicted nucleotidyltransferase component of viral defense system